MIALTTTTRPQRVPQKVNLDEWMYLTQGIDGKAVDKGKDVDGWTIPAAKNKERLPLTNGDVSRSAPELQRLAPEDDDGHIEYKVHNSHFRILACAIV